MIKKRTSLLLEILLACTILTLFIGPLMRKPIEFYRTQIKALKEIEKERLADLSFAEIKMQLLQHRIPWNKLPSKKAPQKIYSLNQAYLDIPHCQQEAIDRRAIMKFQREKISTKGETVRLIEIEIEFSPFEQKKNKSSSSRYIYQTIVKKMGAQVFS